MTSNSGTYLHDCVLPCCLTNQLKVSREERECSCAGHASSIVVIDAVSRNFGTSRLACGAEGKITRSAPPRRTDDMSCRLLDYMADGHGRQNARLYGKHQECMLRRDS